MPFNIELTNRSNGVAIKVQVVKNTINLYFAGAKDAAATVRDNWIHLETHFLLAMPGYIAEPVRGPDAPHIKKDHTHAAETEIMHAHSEFTSEITPERFSAYLTQIFDQQEEHPSKNYQFFVNKSEVADIIKKFAIYYSEYKNSSTEALYEEETALSPEEQLAYDEAAEKERGAREEAEREAQRAARLFSSLLIATVLTGRHPLHSMPGPQGVSPEEESEDKVECTIM